MLMSIAHNIYGEQRQLPALKALTGDPVMIGSQRIMVFQGGLLLLAVGLVQILASAGMIALEGVARYFPVGVVLLNFLTALLVTALFHREVLKAAVPQFAVFTAILCLQLLSL